MNLTHISTTPASIFLIEEVYRGTYEMIMKAKSISKTKVYPTSDRKGININEHNITTYDMPNIQ